MTENYMEYPERCALKLVLDFVESYNKKDENKDVAQAAQDLTDWMLKVEDTIKARI